MAEGTDPAFNTCSVYTVSGRMQRKSEGLHTGSMTSNAYTLSERVQGMSEGLHTVSSASSVGTQSTEVRLGPAECDTCLETGLVWTRPCCLAKTCLPCLEAYVEGKISDGVIDIQCPGHSCDTQLTPSVIKQAVDTIKAKRFSFLRVKSDRCQYKKACPMCDHIVTLDDIFLQYFGNLESIIVCPKCLKEWCFQCMVPWHEGYTCTEYCTFKSDTGVDKWAGGKQNSTGERNAQQCPMCKVWIQKIAGCHLMTCTECRTRFCYLCGVQTTLPHGSGCVVAPRGRYHRDLERFLSAPTGIYTRISPDLARYVDIPHVGVQTRTEVPVNDCHNCGYYTLYVLGWALPGLLVGLSLIYVCYRFLQP